MRTTPSRFSAFVASVEPDFEGRPTVLNAPRVPSGAPGILEQRYPAAVRTLTLLWGYPELNQWFDKIATGADPRLDFEPAALADLMLLAAVHQRICPHRPAKSIDEVYGASRWAGAWRPARYRG